MGLISALPLKGPGLGPVTEQAQAATSNGVDIYVAQGSAHLPHSLFRKERERELLKAINFRVLSRPPAESPLIGTLDQVIPCLFCSDPMVALPIADFLQIYLLRGHVSSITFRLFGFHPSLCPMFRVYALS